MRINEPPYLVPGDIVICTNCNCEVSQVKRFILQNEKIDPQDLKPIQDKWLIRAHNPMVCYHCVEPLTRNGRFKAVIRR